MLSVYGQASYSCVCVWHGWGEGVCASPLYTLALFRCNVECTINYKPGASGTNTAVKHQSWQLRQMLLATAFLFDHICVYYASVHCTFVWFLTSYGVLCQVQVAGFKSKINLGSINNMSGIQGEHWMLPALQKPHKELLILQWESLILCSTCIYINAYQWWISGGKKHYQTVSWGSKVKHYN